MTTNRRSVRRLLALALLTGGPLAFAEPSLGIGLLKVVRGEVLVERQDQQLPAEVGMPIFEADRLRTGRDGFVGVTFTDNSLLSLGAGGQFAIDRYRYDSTTHEGAFEATLSAGRLAVVAGKISRQTPDAMRLRTPQSLLGVRGAEFVVEAGVVSP